MEHCNLSWDKWLVKTCFYLADHLYCFVYLIEPVWFSGSRRMCSAFFRVNHMCAADVWVHPLTWLFNHVHIMKYKWWGQNTFFPALSFVLDYVSGNIYLFSGSCHKMYASFPPGEIFIFILTWHDFLSWNYTAEGSGWKKRHQ